MIVLNDNHNTFEGVAFTLSGVLPGVSYDQGMKLANTIHNAGARRCGPAIASRRSCTGRSCASPVLTMAPLEQT